MYFLERKEPTMSLQKQVYGCKVSIYINQTPILSTWGI